MRTRFLGTGEELESTLMEAEILDEREKPIEEQFLLTSRGVRRAAPGVLGSRPF